MSGVIRLLDYDSTVNTTGSEKKKRPGKQKNDQPEGWPDVDNITTKTLKTENLFLILIVIGGFTRRTRWGISVQPKPVIDFQKTAHLISVSHQHCRSEGISFGHPDASDVLVTVIIMDHTAYLLPKGLVMGDIFLRSVRLHDDGIPQPLLFSSVNAVVNETGTLRRFITIPLAWEERSREQRALQTVASPVPISVLIYCTIKLSCRILLHAV